MYHRLRTPYEMKTPKYNMQAVNDTALPSPHISQQCTLKIDFLTRHTRVSMYTDVSDLSFSHLVEGQQPNC